MRMRSPGLSSTFRGMRIPSLGDDRIGNGIVGDLG
jgi:hypothetical protein